MKINHLIQKITNLDTDSIKKSLGFVYSYAKRHIIGMTVYTAVSLSSVLTGLLSSYISKDLVDIVTGHESGELFRYFFLTVVIAVSSIAISQISGYISFRVNLSVSTSIKTDISGKVIRADWEELTKFHSGDIISRINGDTSTIATGVISFIPGIITNVARFAGALFMVIRYDWTFAVFSLLGIPFSILLSRKMAGRMQNNTLDSSKKNAQIYSFMQESFANIGFVKAFDLIGLYIKRFNEYLQNYNNLRIKYNRMSIISSVIMSISGLLISYASYGWGIYRVWSGAISYGTMTMFLNLASSLSGSVNSLGNSFSMAISLDTSARRILELLGTGMDDFSDDEKADRFLLKCETQQFRLNLRNAAFHYQQDNETVFSDVNLDMIKGKVYAIVGPSGDGKTTFLRCILSLARLSEGEGYFQSCNDRLELSPSTRKLFSSVPQKSFLFSGDVKDNLSFADPQASDTEMIEALKTACAWDFLTDREGLQTEVFEGGGGLSSGQLQRIAIARALLRKAPVLVLDEATSALDTETEARVIENIMRDKANRLTIITTHRPKILEYCDEIYRFEDSHLIRVQNNC